MGNCKQLPYIKSVFARVDNSPLFKVSLGRPPTMGASPPGPQFDKGRRRPTIAKGPKWLTLVGSKT